MKTKPNASLRVCVVLASLAVVGCQPAEQIEGPSGGLSGVKPAVAVRNGHAVAVWHRAHEIHASSYAGAGWSAPVVIGSGTFPDIATASSTAALAVFADGGTLYAAIRSGSGWLAPQVLTTGTSLAYGVAQAGNGRGAVVWSSGGQVYVTTQEGGGWDGATRIGSGSSGNPQIAISDAEVEFAAWCSGGTIRAARRVHPYSWEAAVGSSDQCCAPPGLDTPGPAVSIGVSAAGDAVVVGGSSQRVCELRYKAGTGWLATSFLGSPGPLGSAPQVAVNPSGGAFVAWRDEASGNVIKARAYVPASGWGPTLVGPIAGDGKLGVGIGSSGNAAIVYLKPDGVFAVNYTSGALSTSPTNVATGAGSYYLQIGCDPSSTAQGVSIWQMALGSSEAVYAARLGL